MTTPTNVPPVSSYPGAFPAPGPAARRRRWPWILGGIVAVLIIIGIAAPSTPAPTAAPSTLGAALGGDATADVKITTCDTTGQASMAQVTARVTNSTSQVQSYLITVSLNDPAGNRVAEANGATNSLAPGQSAQVDLIGASATGATGVISCTVANVTRIPV